AAAGTAASRRLRTATATGRPMRNPSLTWYLSRMATTTDDEVVLLLSGVPVFETLGPRELAQIAQLAVPRKFPAGHGVFREGASSDTCYLVRSGHSRAIREHPDGRSITLATFGPGDFFGELAMFDDERRSATVEAIDALECLAILGPDMRRLMREHTD